jgi:hypothetical protein
MEVVYKELKENGKVPVAFIDNELKIVQNPYLIIINPEKE